MCLFELSILNELELHAAESHKNPGNSTAG